MREAPVIAVLGRSRRLREYPAPRCPGDRRRSGTTGKKFLVLYRNAAESSGCRDIARLWCLFPPPLPPY